MANKDEMTVEEILQACRIADGAGGAATAAEEPVAAESVAAEPTPAPAKPAAVPTGKQASAMTPAEILAAARAGKGAAKPAASEPAAAAATGKQASDMSVAEIMAAARTGKAGASAEKPKPKSAAKPAAKTKAAKAPAAKKESAGPRDTSSILAAARKAVKPGPLSKAEAAAQGKPVAKKKIDAPAMPSKPAYASPQPAKSTADEDRRGFLAAMMGGMFGSALAIGFTSLGVWSAVGGLGLARFMFPNILTEPPSKFKIGYPGDFSPGTVATKFKAQYGVWVVNSEYEGVPQINALKSVCTHLGCTPNWLEGEQKFKCPCHGSGFYKDGINFEGPAPRPLERYAIRIADDGQLEVDKSKKFQEEMGQWKDSASFVLI